VYNRRVVAAAARRSAGRLGSLDAAILREDERKAAFARRGARLMTRSVAVKMSSEVASGAAAARRLSASVLGVAAAAASGRRGAEADARREHKTSEVVTRAKLCSTPRSAPVKIVVGDQGVGLAWVGKLPEPQALPAPMAHAEDGDEEPQVISKEAAGLLRGM
jgi:hypothetical protein